MAEPHEYFMDKAHLEVAERIGDAMEKQGVSLMELASRAEVLLDDLEEMLRSGEGLTINMVGRLFYHLSYKLLVTTAPLSDKDRVQAVFWSEN